MNKQDIQNILDNIDDHITIHDAPVGAWGHVAEFECELWQAWIVYEENDAPDAPEGAMHYTAHDHLYAESFATFDEALTWMRESIDGALSYELSELDSDTDALVDEVSAKMEADRRQELAEADPFPYASETVQINMRCSDREKALIKRAAEATDKTMTDYLLGLAATDAGFERDDRPQGAAGHSASNE